MRKTALLGFVGVILLSFLALNVIASNIAYSPLLYKVVTLSDVAAAREYLANLEGSGLKFYHEGDIFGLSEVNGVVQEDLYAQQSRYLNSHFDNIFAREVDVTRLNAEQAISRYEDILALNPQNPQVLVKLGLLYEDAGNNRRANELFDEARSIDPWIEFE